MSKIYNVLVESSKRTSGSPSQFAITLLWPLNQPKSIALESVQIYNSQYTINNFNNKLNWTTSTSTPITSTLINGNYTATSLATMIETVMNDDNTTSDLYKVSFSSVSGKITILNDNSNNFQLNFLNANNSCYKLLGFLNQNYTGNNTYSGDNVVCLNTKLYKIYLDFISQNTYTANQLTGLIAIVPNNTQFGDLICYNPPLAKSFQLRNINDLSTFKITVRDDNDNLCELNGVDWSMNLCVST